MKINANAKINLALDVTGKRDDGYHEVCMILQEIDLCDTLEIALTDDGEIHLSCDGLEDTDKCDNLAYKAARLFLDYLGSKNGCNIKLTKNIPVGAGLAGGSADCACVLDCLYEKYGVLDYSDVEEIAASLGSDINFCLDKYRCALCTDRGIKLEKCTPFEWENVLVCVPDLGMKTSDIYNAFDASPILFEDNPSCVVKDALAFKDTKTVFSHIVNSFESICEKECADISHIKSIMTSHGSNASSMSGSGSSVFGFFNDAQSLNACKAELTKKYKKCFECRTVTE